MEEINLNDDHIDGGGNLPERQTIKDIIQNLINSISFG